MDMASELSASNLSFNFLEKSSEFLNEIIHNITSCILLLNNKMELQAFNDPIKTIFTNKKDEDILYVRCGEAIGCSYTVEEKKNVVKQANISFVRCGKQECCRILKRNRFIKKNWIGNFFTEWEKSIKAFTIFNKAIYV